jgi:DNA polymerase-1
MNIPSYKLVSNAKDLKRFIKYAKKHGPTALDFETTSLDPKAGRVRTANISNHKTRCVVDFDRIKGGFRAHAHLFRGLEWIVFYAGFEYRWFLDAGVGDIRLWDVGNLRRAILGGGHFKLKQIVLWDLEIEMSKEEQASDWSAPKLSKRQLDYAYMDGHLTYSLWDHWSKRMDMMQFEGFLTLNDMVPAVVEMELSGVRLDQEKHADLCAAWTKTKLLRIDAVRKFVDVDEVKNINSDSQWSDYFGQNAPQALLDIWPRTEKTGQLEMKNKTLGMLSGAVPNTPLSEFFRALSEYKTITKYLSSFGETMITAARGDNDGRVHARYNIGAAKTCRFSSSGPNLQQIPRDRDLLGVRTSVRQSFIAARDRLLVSLDYSGIELRVLALLAQDDQLLEDVVYGDVHLEVAQKIAGKKLNKKTRVGKELRQGAKGVSFGIIYGSGAAGLAMTMHTSLSNAGDYIDFWQTRYPRAFDYRFKMQAEAQSSKYIRMVDGGTVYMGARPDLPKCANYPVQRAALSVMAKAIVRHKNDLDIARANGTQRHTLMLSTIHDALIDEVSRRDSKRCLKMMREAMTAGYLDVFPGAPTDRLVEGGIGPSWGLLEEVEV